MDASCHVRLEELFTPEGNGALSYFYASNRIICNPAIITHILRDFSDLTTLQQERTLTEIKMILEQVTTNAYAINSLHSPACLEMMVDLLPSQLGNYVVFNKLLAIFDQLLPMSSLHQALIDRALKKIPFEMNGDNGCVDGKTLFGIISILKSLFNCKIGMDREPEKMLVFHGGNGLEIRPSGKKDINWMFSNGVSVYFWLNIESIKFGTEASLPKLFTFYSPNNGGLECYLVDNKIYYRTVGSKYNSPKIGSNGICLGSIQPKKWNFIGIEHEGPKRLLGKSQIVFHLNESKSSFSLSPLSISSKQKMQIVFFDKTYCRTSSICVVPYFVQDNFADTLNKNKNSIDSIKNPKAMVFEQKQGKLYERSDLGFCSDSVLHRDKKICFENIIPLFHIYKLAGGSSQYPILNELLSLFVLYLYKSPQNQTEACSQNYLHVMAELIKSLPDLHQKFNQETVNTLLHIKQTITNPELLSQYHGEFLWGFIDSRVSPASRQMLLEVIKNNFTQSVAYCSSVIGLDQMINALRILAKTSKCCEKHYRIMLSRFEKDPTDEEVPHFADRDLTLEYILRIIQLYMQNEKLNSAQEIYKLCKVLSSKFSPCLTLSFIGVIKRVLAQKLNQKLPGNQSKKILEYLQAKKVYLIFLHVIENSFFAEVKAECIKIIYTLLLKRSALAEQEQISYRLSRALWKINENNEAENRPVSIHNSPAKQEEPELGQIQQPSLQKKRISRGSIKMMRMSSLSDEQDSSQVKLEPPENKNKASSIFKQVGPQAPLLTNKTKGSKTFSFNFMSDSAKQLEEDKNSATAGTVKSIQSLQFEEPEQKVEKKVSSKQMQINNEIMEEEKTNENEITQLIEAEPNSYNLFSGPKLEQDAEVEPVIVAKNPKAKRFNLNINTEQINKMYTFGGEKGQQIEISEEEKQAELNKIRRLAKICLAAMRGEKALTPQQQAREEVTKPVRGVLPPMTMSNKALKAREPIKVDSLKLIDEESEPQSAAKGVSKNLKLINTSIPSPNFGSKKSKSPTSINSIYEENLIILYNSLMESCTSLPNHELVNPSIMYIFFSWIPQTNLEVKFLLDFSLILDSDSSLEKIRLLVKMPELYDFLFELTYKTLIFEEMDEKRLYVDRLEEIVKKIFTFIFREEPESIDKFSFIINWCTSKSKQYHPKSLFLTSRYIFFLILDAIEEDLFTNSQNDKLMERNFQHLGIVINKFCKFLPLDEAADSNPGLTVDKHGRVVFNENFEMLASMAPYFTSPWADYLICEKYYLLFKKFFCTDWYRKNLKAFDTYFTTGNVQVLQAVIKGSLNSQLTLLNAQSQFFLKNSFVFSIVSLNRLLFIQKVLSEEHECEERSELVWQTIMIVLFAECTKEKNQKNNSEFIMAFLKNCKTFYDLSSNKSGVVIHLLKCIRETVSQNSNFMANSSIMIDGRETKLSSSSIKSAPFVQFLMQSYINQALFMGEDEYKNFESFKLNFREVEIPSIKNEARIKSQLFEKLQKKLSEVDNRTPDYIEDLSLLMEEENERFISTEVLVQTFNRNARSYFRKLWKNLRIFSHIWRHPQMSFQNDTPFSKAEFTYERQEQNNHYKLRVCKHMSKYRLRYFLKPILLDQSEGAHQSEERAVEKLEIGLQKALAYFFENKLLLGWRVVSWIYPKAASVGFTHLSPSSGRQIEIFIPFRKVRLVKTLTVRHGYLGVVNDKLIFINAFYKEPPSHLAITEYELKKDKNFYKIWQLDLIKQVFKRRYINRKRAIEIFFLHGKSAMFEFYENDHEEFIKKLLKFKGTKCPNFIYNGNKSLDPRREFESLGLLKKWSTYEISNFEYLMQLNNLAGRSYSDLTQYPVMPWVLTYFGNKLTPGDEKNLRDLSLPMGALGSKERSEGFRDRFEQMSHIQQERFHYGTHYSSPAIIYHFLVRMSPFTEGSILLQSGRFDFADRLFFSVMDSFKNATSEYSDVRELIPELYTFPEAYLNINKLDMGVMQNHKRVHNVELPPWTKSNPYQYVSQMRRALEDLNVSRNLNKWIDLIFGYKQRGEEAIKSLNCYVHLTYEDSINYQQLQDEKSIQAIETQVLNFGQTPSQLFNKPHIEKAPFSSLQLSHTICDPTVAPRIYRTSNRANQNAMKDMQKQQFNAMRQSPQSIIHMRWFRDSRLVFIRKNGEMRFYKWHTSQPGSKVPFQCTAEKEKHIMRIGKNAPQSMEYFDPSLRTDQYPIEIINNGHHIALGGLSDGKLLIIDTDSNTVCETYTGHSATVCCVRSDSKDNFLITGDITGRVVVWRIINSCKLVPYNQMHDHERQVTSIFISYDLRCIFTCAMDGFVYGYNIITNRRLRVYRHPRHLPLDHVVVSTSPLPVVLLFCNQESMVYCYSINGQLLMRIQEKEIEHFLSPVLIKDSLGFEHVAYGSEHGQTKFRALPFLGNPVVHTVAEDAAVNTICLSKMSKFVILGCSDGELSVITTPDQPAPPK